MLGLVSSLLVDQLFPLFGGLQSLSKVTVLAMWQWEENEAAECQTETPLSMATSATSPKLESVHPG